MRFVAVEGGRVEGTCGRSPLLRHSSAEERAAALDHRPFTVAFWAGAPAASLARVARNVLAEEQALRYLELEELKVLPCHSSSSVEASPTAARCCEPR